MKNELLEQEKTRFEEMSRTELLETVQPALGTLINTISPDGTENVPALIGLISSCMKLGFGTNDPSPRQKDFGEEVFDLLGLSMSAAGLYWGLHISDLDYRALSLWEEAGFDVGLAMFDLLMCSAYADGGLDPGVEEEIAEIFAPLLEQKIKLEQMSSQLDELEEMMKKLCEEAGIPYPPEDE